MMTKPRLLRASIFALTGFLLSVSYTNCSEVEFGLTEEASRAAAGIYEFSTSFDPETESQGAIDMIWLIDNSGSMSNEAAHVRQNFTSFISTIAAKTNLRLALISASGAGSTSVTLPVSGNNYLQISKTVGSTDGLNILTKAICPSGQSCGGESGDGSLSSFLRTDTKKVLVVVTDDESRMSGSTFMSAYSQIYGNNQLSVFGFVGLSSSACSISRKGQTYIDLAAQTNSEVFDICLSDWTNTFANLADTVVRISRSTITLPTKHGQIESILEVILNGQSLDRNDYSFDGTNTLAIRDSVLSGLNKARVKVTYQVVTQN